MTQEKLKNQISELLSPYANELEDERLGVFLTLSVGRILIKKDIEISNNDLRHITDWLKVAIINNEAWISNFDNDQRPKKLMKFSSIEQIVKEADKAMAIKNQNLSNIKLIEGDEELFAEIQDGYYIVKLLTPEALDNESSQMQHCIGNGAYDNALKRNTVSFLSLRDTSGNPHATLEIVEGSILQLQGKQNQYPIDKYVRVLLPVIQEHKWFTNHIDGFKYMIDQRTKKWENIYDLPDNFIAKFDFFYSLKTINKIKFPKNFTAKSSLSISHSYINTIPENLTVQGSFNAIGTDIKTVPEDLFVGDTLNLSETSIEEYKVGRNTPNIIIFNDCVNLKKLPDNLYVQELQVIYSQSLKSLPKGLVVEDFFNISHSGIKELPDDLIVNGKLEMRWTKIKTIPASLNGCQAINAENSSLKYLSDDIKKIKVSLILNNSKVEKLSNGLSVGKNLYLRNCPIKELPDNLSVGGTLMISGTNIQSLPSDIKAKEIVIDEGQLIEIPDDIDSNLIFIVSVLSLTALNTVKYTVDQYKEKFLNSNSNNL